MPRPAALPYTIDRAVTDEKEFWRHIGSLVDEAVEKALVRHGLPDATRAMQAVLKTQQTLISRVNDVAAAQVALDGKIDRLVSWCTVRGAEADMLNLRLEKFFDLVDSIVTPKSPTPTPPVPDAPPSDQ